MASIKAAAMGVVATVVALLLETILFFVSLFFVQLFNTSTGLDSNAKNLLAIIPFLMVAIMVFTLVGGLIGSVIVGITAHGM